MHSSITKRVFEVKWVIVFVTAILFQWVSSYGQNPLEIFSQSKEQCQHIKHGSYKMLAETKLFFNADTTRILYQCQFEKQEEDTIFPIYFYHCAWKDGVQRQGVVWDGSNLAILDPRDSTAILFNKSNRPEGALKFIRELTLYPPFTSTVNNPFNIDLNAQGVELSFLGNERIKDDTCYHLELSQIPGIPGDSSKINMHSHYNLWIREKDFLPILYTRTVHMQVTTAEITQFERFTLESFQIDPMKKSDSISLDVIPSFYRVKDNKQTELLRLNSVAPDWEVKTSNGNLVSSGDFKGHLLLLDFFFQSCVPCQKAFPHLIELYKKFKDLGLIVIGIDPVETEESSLPDFCMRKGIIYPVLVGNKEITGKFHITAYPTLYLIDETGTILFSKQGYDQESFGLLEKEISKHLE